MVHYQGFAEEGRVRKFKVVISADECRNSFFKLLLYLLYIDTRWTCIPANNRHSKTIIMADTIGLSVQFVYILETRMKLDISPQALATN